LGVGNKRFPHVSEIDFFYVFKAVDGGVMTITSPPPKPKERGKW